MNSSTLSRELHGVAQLFGLLLLNEIDEALLMELQPHACEFEQIGIHIPDAKMLDDLAAEFFELFVNPQKSTPLVESLYRGGSYEGEAAVDVRQIAESAGLELDGELSRGAPADHLGVMLMLWVQIDRLDSKAAEAFAREHLSWAFSPLTAIKGRTFYPKLCLACAHLISEIVKGYERQPDR